MACERRRPEAIVAKRRRSEVLSPQAASASDVIGEIGVMERTDHVWRKEFGA
ncbi:MAG: hypothetical protein AAGM38_05390 [Pseudomonadota bacterium]